MRLGEAIRKYVAAKRSSGMAFDHGAYTLRVFRKTAGWRTSISKVSSDVVRAFLNSHGSGTRYWNHKYHTLSGLWAFAIQRGYTDWSPLPARALKELRLFTPYIYTHEELKRLMGGINTYQTKWYRLEPVTLRAMLLLLYGAGLRIGEAIRLACSDVDLSEATLTIRCTKFYKTRRIAIGPQLSNVLREYDGNRRECGHSRHDGSPFFTYNNGGTVARGVLETSFRKLRHHVGIGPTTGRKQPRVHDLRHTFAVHRVIAWYRSGLDVQRLLPGLSTYLGHVDLASTQVYLTMTPELLAEASLRFERYVGEVVHGEA
jgi:integrase/recombinase XerD